MKMYHARNVISQDTLHKSYLLLLGIWLLSISSGHLYASGQRKIYSFQSFPYTWSQLCPVPVLGLGANWHWWRDIFRWILWLLRSYQGEQGSPCDGKLSI